jgi:hypothetical protein
MATRTKVLLYFYDLTLLNHFIATGLLLSKTSTNKRINIRYFETVS